jgi:hypothetical protein
MALPKPDLRLGLGIFPKRSTGKVRGSDSGKPLGILYMVL